VKKYFNTSENGYNINLFDAELGKLDVLKKNNAEYSYDVNKNNLELIGLKINEDSQTILGLECDCIVYNARMENNQSIILEYCYNENTPKINPKLFEKHKGMFLSDFYKIASRPYLKFSIKTNKFKIIHTAIDLVEKEFDPSELSVE